MRLNDEELPRNGFDTVVAALAEVRDAVLVIAGSVEQYGLKAKREANRVRNWHDTWGARPGVGDRHGDPVRGRADGR